MLCSERCVLARIRQRIDLNGFDSPSPRVSCSRSSPPWAGAGCRRSDVRTVWRSPRPGSEGACRGERPQRSRKADDLRIQAVELTRRVGDPRHYQGPGLDPSLLGWLCALAIGYTQARGEIERLAGPGVMAGVDWLDMPLVLDRLMPEGDA